ncbi:hypothetical protein AYO39_01365 [Actinobacteria bacterium SCGC AG-212-D09]|nr:hypothetical protein AYO39_01365 [Actinobacteria bacterium SCGC AG-212-D09]
MADAMSLRQISSSRPSDESDEQLVELVYELLDAHSDTDRLARNPSARSSWRAHLQYLRDLQRTGREILARAANP